jgi:predicted transcriptional regulator
MSGIVRQTKTTKINEVGEIIETEKEQIINFQKTDDFIMTFTKDLGYLKNLSKGEIVVFFGLLQIVNNNNEIILNAGIKKRISENFDIKLESINVLLSQLVKKNMIIKTEEMGVYLLNVFLFGKGKWTDIKKMRMLIEWDFKEKKKTVSIEKEYLNEEEILEKQIKQQEEILKQLQNKKEKNLFNFEEENKY